MIPANFAYEQPKTVDDALSILSGDPDAKILSGGHSLLPLMKLRLVRPSRLVDISRVPELHLVEHHADRMVIGAAVKYHEILADRQLAEIAPILQQACAVIADPQVRHRGTIGGSAVHADPASDLAAVFLAADVRFRVRGAAGERLVPVSDWYLGPLLSALQSDEILMAVEFPRPLPARQAYLKFAHPASGYALAGAAALVDLRPDGRAHRVCVAVTGAAQQPFRARQTESQLAGRELNSTVVREAAALDAAAQEYPEDQLYPADWRRNLAAVMIVRALEKALQN
jgi:carbon-monoxide dehydrogenase medium subunit